MASIFTEIIEGKRLGFIIFEDENHVAILDKFETFSRQTKLKYWSQVTNQVVKRYVAWLPKQRKSGYAERTLTIEHDVYARAIDAVVRAHAGVVPARAGGR